MAPWILQLIIYSALIIQLLYFLITSVCYIYHNPQYRVWWALFYQNPPTNVKSITTNMALPTIAEQRTITEITESGDASLTSTTFRNLDAPPPTQPTSTHTSTQHNSA
eukprot:410396_1